MKSLIIILSIITAIPSFAETFGKCTVKSRKTISGTVLERVLIETSNLQAYGSFATTTCTFKSNDASFVLSTALLANGPLFFNLRFKNKSLIKFQANGAQLSDNSITAYAQHPEKSDEEITVNCEYNVDPEDIRSIIDCD